MIGDLPVSVEYEGLRETAFCEAKDNTGGRVDAPEQFASLLRRERPFDKDAEFSRREQRVDVEDHSLDRLVLQVIFETYKRLVTGASRLSKLCLVEDDDLSRSVDDGEGFIGHGGELEIGRQPPFVLWNQRVFAEVRHGGRTVGYW